MSEAMTKLRHIAATARPSCVDCRFFMEDEVFQKFGWFGLRKNVSTAVSVRRARCAKHFDRASFSWRFDCKNGKDFEARE